MNTHVFVQIAWGLIDNDNDNDNDLLTTDQSNPICGKRFAAPGIPQTEG